MLRKLVLVSFLCFIYTLSIVPQVQADPDSVNWDNLNLNFRVPELGTDGQQPSDTVSDSTFDFRPQTYLDARLNLEGLLSNKEYFPQDSTKVDQIIHDIQYKMHDHFRSARAQTSFVEEQAVNPNGAGFNFSDTWEITQRWSDAPVLHNEIQYGVDLKFMDSTTLNQTPRTDIQAIGEGFWLKDPFGVTGSNLTQIQSAPPTTNGESFYVNDRWQMNDHWSFKLGTRYEDIDQIQNNQIPNDSDNVTPRIGFSYDVKGDRKQTFSNYYNQNFSEGQANGSATFRSSFGNDELPGFRNGIHGPILAWGDYKGEGTLAFFDASGASVGSVNRDQAETNPSLIQDLLWLSELRSRDYYANQFNFFSNIPNIGDQLRSQQTSSTTTTQDTYSLTTTTRLEAIREIELKIKTDTATDMDYRTLNILKGVPPGFVGTANDMNGDGIADIISGIDLGHYGSDEQAAVEPFDIFAEDFNIDTTFQWDNHLRYFVTPKIVRDFKEDEPYAIGLQNAYHAPFTSSTFACTSTPAPSSSGRQSILDNFKETGDIAGAARALAAEGNIVYDQTSSQTLSECARAIADETGRNYDEVRDELESDYLAHGDDWLTATKGNCYEFVHLAGWLAGSGNASYRQFQGGLTSLIDSSRMMAWDGEADIPAGKIIVGRVSQSMGGQDSFGFFHTAVSLGNGMVANNRDGGVKIERIEDVFGAFYTNPVFGQGIYFGDYSGYGLPKSANSFLGGEIANNLNTPDLDQTDILNRNTLIDNMMGNGPPLTAVAFTDDLKTYHKFLQQTIDGLANGTPYYVSNFQRWKKENPNQIVTTSPDQPQQEFNTGWADEKAEKKSWEELASQAFSNMLNADRVQYLFGLLDKLDAEHEALVNKYGANNSQSSFARNWILDDIEEIEDELLELGVHPDDVFEDKPLSQYGGNYQFNPLHTFRVDPLRTIAYRRIITDYIVNNEAVPVIAVKNQTNFGGCYTQNVLNNPSILGSLGSSSANGQGFQLSDKVDSNLNYLFRGTDTLNTNLYDGGFNDNSFKIGRNYLDDIVNPIDSTFNPSTFSVLRLGNDRNNLSSFSRILQERVIETDRATITVKFFEKTNLCTGSSLGFEINVDWHDAKKKKKAKIEEKPVSPNDPFFFHKEKKKKKLLGILGSSKKPSVNIGGLVKMGHRDTSRVGFGHEQKSEVKDQWGLHAIGYKDLSQSDSVWHLVDEQKKSDVVIAIIDTGFDFDNPDFPQHVWINLDEKPGNGIDDDHNGYIDDVQGWNFYDNNAELTDYRGHGTFVAGIIAAKSDNGYGIAGIHPGVTIMPIKISNEEGETGSFQVLRAVKYAVDNGANIINISVAGNQQSNLLQLAFNYAERKNVLVVVASGNEKKYTQGYGMAANRRVLSVGSSNIDGTFSVISSWGPNNALIAPGEEILSLVSKDTSKRIKHALKEKGVHTMTGTSFSAPMVAATASLLLTKYPYLTAKQLMDIIISTADDMEDAGWDDETGAGKLNAYAALSFKPKEILNVMVSEIKINKNSKGKKIASIDVFATVQGQFEEFTVDVGKTHRAKKFKTVAGPFKEAADYSWVARIPWSDLKGNTDWVIRISAKDKDGNVKVADTEITLR